MAKYSRPEPEGAQKAKLAALGFAEQYRFRQFPGLVAVNLEDVQFSRLAVPRKEVRKADLLIERLQRLRESGLFEFVEPDYVQRISALPGDARFQDDTLWGLRNRGRFGGVSGADIDAVRAWGITTGSAEVIVAVIDTGIRYSHRELAPRMWRNPGEIPNNRIDDDRDGYVDNVYGINAVDGTGNPLDHHDHGTHVAGIIGAAANDGHPHVGVAWNVQLMACKFLSGDGFGFTSDAIECIDFALSKGARILNLSWGGGPFSASLFEALRRARERGCLVICAAGNDNSDNDQRPYYPASYLLDNIISVAALDRRDRLAEFSNYGAARVHLAAPGVEIFSTSAASDSAYATFEGTSMAAPYGSGVAALLLSQFPRASLQELRIRLLTGATGVSSLRDKTTTGGRLNAYRALTAQPDGELEWSLLPLPGTDLRAGSTISMQVIVTDVAGVPNASVTAHIPRTGQEFGFRNDGVAPDAVAGDAIYSADVTLPATAGVLNLQLTITAPEKKLLHGSANYLLLAPPANDDFVNAAQIPETGGLFFANNKLATMEPGEPVHAQIGSVAGSVWWKWVAPRNVKVLVDTAGSSFDTVLAVYTNNTLRSLRAVAAVDDIEKNSHAMLHFDAVSGTTYWMAVAGYSPRELGDIRLRFEPEGDPDRAPPKLTISSPMSGLTVTNTADNKVVISGTAIDPAPFASGVSEVAVQVNKGLARAAFGTAEWSSTNQLELGLNIIKVVARDFAGNVSSPSVINLYYRPLWSPNDHFGNAAELFGREGTVRAESSAATKEHGEPMHAGNPGGKSVWWHYQAPADGVLSLTTEGSSFNTLLGLYSGTRVTNLLVLASNDNATPALAYSRIEQAIRGNRIYFIAVDGFFGQSGSVRLGYEFVPGPVYEVMAGNSPGGLVTPSSGMHAAGSPASFRAIPESGYEFQGWEGSITSAENPLHVVVNANMDLRARFRFLERTDDFETGDFTRRSWSHSGNAPWRVQTNVAAAGHFAAQSGAISHGQRSSLLLTERCMAGRGSFDVRIGSEENWDQLEFFVNGMRVGRWSGQKNWGKFAFDVVAGTNRFEWRYSKDFQTTVAPDAAFIDNLELPLFSEKTPPSPARLTAVLEAMNGMRLEIRGDDARTYILQRSEDLKRWDDVLTNTMVNGRIQWLETLQPAQPTRFYRALGQ